eukprot:TRINITY_DN25938_c0_g1_i1.p1 TRINITY_DN25938_c0_g1~~TRINITY_DN25938_c0_g1_i1.p1  ORF type:complete len:395 (+),score=77.28 TRINITY_DN25938_c0_g1_i1:122-1306(+)
MLKATVDTMKSPIVCVQYSNSGEVIAAGTQHGNVELLYLGAKTEVVPLKIHTSGINSLAFSSGDKYLLTSSSDKSASMWKVLGTDRGNLLLQLRQEHTNIESLALQKKEQVKSFVKEVRKASFYYQDLLIALASENILRFYSYEIVDPKLKDDVKRLQSKVRYKEVQRYTLRDAQSITTFAIHNRIKSHYALIVGSNKSLHLYNINMCEEVFSLNESQGRTIHTAKFFEGSDFVGSQGSEYNIFGTASLDSTIKVWDVRQSGAVRSYSDHANRMVHVGFDFSPCMRYVVSGSEDRNFVVYDMRVDGKYLEKSAAGDHSDTVTDVSFSPKKPALVTGALDCKLRAFQGRALPAHSVFRGGFPGLVEEWNKELKVESMKVADSKDRVMQAEREPAY